MTDKIFIVSSSTQKKILQVLIKHGELNSYDIQNLTGVPESSVFRCLNSLMKLRYVTISGRDVSHKGGPNPRRFSLV